MATSALPEMSTHTLVCNPFVPNAPFLYPLKASENPTVFLCFQGKRKGALGTNEFNTLIIFDEHNKVSTKTFQTPRLNIAAVNKKIL